MHQEFLVEILKDFGNLVVRGFRRQEHCRIVYYFLLLNGVKLMAILLLSNESCFRSIATSFGLGLREKFGGFSLNSPVEQHNPFHCLKYQPLTLVSS